LGQFDSLSRIEHHALLLSIESICEAGR
jgi:hypothetical protein